MATAEVTLFFFLSKFLAPLEAPSVVLESLLVLGLAGLWIPTYFKVGRVVITASLAVLAIITFSPLTNWLSRPLEKQYPAPKDLPMHVDGIIVLGGGFDMDVSTQFGSASLSPDADKMTEFVALSRRYPRARLVFSGGMSASFRSRQATEADVARWFFQKQGVDTKRITFEGRSRDTFENVINSKRIVRPGKGETWLLVSVAEDLPRTMAVFKAVRWSVVPIPVRYCSDKDRTFHATAQLAALDRTTHEWLGLAAYYLAGRIGDSSLQAPKND